MLRGTYLRLLPKIAMLRNGRLEQLRRFLDDDQVGFDDRGATVSRCLDDVDEYRRRSYGESQSPVAKPL